MITLDTETCGFVGPIVLLQYAYNDEEPTLYDVWKHPIQETLDLFERFANHSGGILGFNLAYDVFHIAQMYTTLLLMKDKSEYLEDHLDEYAEKEPLGRDGPCWKPITAHDVMLHARKTEYQSTMDRKDIRIKKIPASLADSLAKELEKRIPLKDIYFARRKDKYAPKWQIVERKDSEGYIDPDWCDIVVKFKASSALKALATDALGLKEDTVLLFSDIGLPKKFYPVELAYAPFAKAVGSSRDWKGAWPEKIQFHINHWAYHSLARKYAADDVRHTRNLWRYFGSPPFGDDDSILACMVGSARWKGYNINISAMKRLRELVKGRTKKLVGTKKIDIPTAPRQVRYYVDQHLSETEKLMIGDLSAANELKTSTKKTILETIAAFRITCPQCGGIIACPACDNKGSIFHPAAIAAQEVLGARKAWKEDEVFEKLIRAERFHAAFVVIGAKSSRMAGGGGRLNPQGIKKTKEVRKTFPLAWDGMVLCGGDFSGFEVTLAEACWNDPLLRADLLTCERCKGVMIFDEIYRDYKCTRCGSNKGQSIHGLFGTFLYPPLTYDQIKATSGTDDDKYTRSKSGVFAVLYFAEAYTLHERLGIPLDIAEEAVTKFNRKYKVAARERQKIKNQFQSMRQPGGIGTKVEWHTPADYIETIFGFRRYFTLENKICHELFNLASNPPKEWQKLKIRVQRRDRFQTPGGAIASALYAAAFAIQGQNTRAAGNHVIQGSGAQITKRVQRKIWDLQPSGVHDWLVSPMNVHDEIMCPTHPNLVDRVEEVVSETVESFREKVPLIKMEWRSGLPSWGEK